MSTTSCKYFQSNKREYFRGLQSLKKKIKNATHLLTHIFWKPITDMDRTLTS